MRRSPPLVILAALTVALAATPVATPAPRDPAARGLDLFLHLADRAAPGATLPVQVQVLGFPTVLSLEPLAGVPIEAAWDPEHLGPGASAVPPPVRATTDPNGRAHLNVPIPDGDERDLVLLVGARSGNHQRTREITIHRLRPHDVSLHLTDSHVVPGSTVSAWVVVTSAITGEPVPSAPVDLDLLEGGIPRHHARLSTDASGSVMARVPIPRTDEPAWSWQLVARSTGPKGNDAGSNSLRLVPREETPGTPSLFAWWTQAAVRPGERATYLLRVYDATDTPIASLPVRTWIGPRGTEAPKEDDAWIKASTESRTDASGRVEGSFTAPSTIGKAGTDLQLVARTVVEGHALEQTSRIEVGLTRPRVELIPEASALVPGIEQRLLFRVRDGKSNPVKATFTLTADGLQQDVTTDAFGEAEIRWNVPPEIGAHHKIGPCSLGVAAAVVVRPQGDIPALDSRRDPFEPCVPVNRNAAAILRPAQPIARAGDALHVRIERAPSQGRAAATPWSVVLRSIGGAASSSAWIADGAEGADIPIPEGARGLWSISAAAPSPDRAAVVSTSTILVVPRTLPALVARVTGGRAAPGGAVDVDVDLSDGHGHGLPGTVAAVVFDAYGGGSDVGLHKFDTRRVLCGIVSVEDQRCAALLEGDRSADPWRRGILGEQARVSLAPSFDPAGAAKQAMSDAFRDVVSSLEGAVFESTADADLLRDARRKSAGGWAFNPELFTLVTSSMEPRPTTPGGEPLALADLVAIDPQVTFDNVARRVTRLKLFRVLNAVREFRHDQRLDPDEPALRDPNALLRRLLEEHKLDDAALLDPWGGTIQFARATGPALPFVSVISGFELRAPGPDGTLGSADDVRDPLGRVLQSKSPYAVAVGEDKVVDARAQLAVGDATVSAWSSLLESLTGTSLGHGAGTGTGQGFGSGHGRLGGSHRTKPPQVRMGRTSVRTGDAFFSPPVRTDDRGHVRIHVPLGDAETTWRIALVGIPDRALPATTTVDVPVSVPLSARADAGLRWTEGDAVDVAITVRNRTAKALSATLDLEAGGVASIASPAPTNRSTRSLPPASLSLSLSLSTRASRTVTVAAGGTTATSVRLKASAAGTARLSVTTRAPGVATDAIEETWEVAPPGEPTTTFQTVWVDGSADLSSGLKRDDHPLGSPRLTLERGPHSALVAALEAMNPDRLTTPAAMADAVEVAGRIRSWAIARGGEGDPLATRAAEIARRAVGRFVVYQGAVEPSSTSRRTRGDAADERDRATRDDPTWAAASRTFRFGPPAEIKELPKPHACPPEGTPTSADVPGLDAEPPPVSGSVAACWDAFVTGTVQAVIEDRDPVSMARAVLALAERPHRAATRTTLIDRLRAEVQLTPSGAITLPGARAKDRSARATVFAALLVAARSPSPGPAPAGLLTAWALVQRDTDGGYGSPSATRAVVRSLLDADADRASKSIVTVIEDDRRRSIEVDPSSLFTLPLDAKTRAVRLETKGPGVIARLDRLVLRPWTRPPEGGESPVHLSVTWPSARAGKTAVVRLSLRHDLGRPATIDTRLPLPPGVSLAEPVRGARQVQGILSIRTAMDASALPTTIELPLRFALGGVVTVPEGSSRLAFEEAPRALSPPRPLQIE
jgi:hypothetical protein